MDRKIIAQLTKVLAANRKSQSPVKEYYVKDFLNNDAEMIKWFRDQ